MRLLFLLSVPTPAVGEPQNLTQGQGGSNHAPSAQGSGSREANASEARKEAAQSSLLWHMGAAGPAPHCQTSLSLPASLHRCVQEPPQLSSAQLWEPAASLLWLLATAVPRAQQTLNLGCGAAAEELSCPKSLAGPPDLWHFPATFLC